MQNFFRQCLYLSVLHLKPDFSYSSVEFGQIKLWDVKQRINCSSNVTGKILFKLASKSSLLLEYDH